MNVDVISYFLTTDWFSLCLLHSTLMMMVMMMMMMMMMIVDTDDNDDNDNVDGE